MNRPALKIGFVVVLLAALAGYFAVRQAAKTSPHPAGEAAKSTRPPGRSSPGR